MGRLRQVIVLVIHEEWISKIRLVWNWGLEVQAITCMDYFTVKLKHVLVFVLHSKQLLLSENELNQTRAESQMAALPFLSALCNNGFHSQWSVPDAQ